MLSTLQMCDSDAQNADCAEFITNDSINAASGMKKGILECVKLWSFMCHEYIEFNLSDHVNFVIGRNGSGKSAILSGIIIGLGGKSQATNRGSSLANFIKKGRPNATVEITLNNIDSYKSQEYGTYIVIRRRFNHDGVSLYNISGEFGLVSNKKDELDQMLDYFNIQVENPTTVLNQDLARNFLASSSTNEKYNFFLKATQLDQIYEMVSFAANEKKKAQAIIQHKEQVLPNLKQEIKVLEEKMSSAVTISQLRDKVRECSVLITWILVKNKEELLGKYEEKKISLNKKFEIIDEKVEKLEKDKASLKSLHENIIFELNELHQQMQNKEIDCQNKQIEIADLKRSVKTMQDQKRQIHCDSQTAKDTLVSMQQK
ncbi:MAG: Structural maintenance of chromosomes protein 6, partial [Marteilia pararefringens]